MLDYSWANGARFPAEPQAIGERCERIRRKNGGIVTPELVVEDARAKNSPMHCCFEWRDVKAATLYRLDQARLILRSLVVVVDERMTEPVRAFVAVRTPDDDDVEPTERKAYTSVHDALADPALRQQVLATALSDLKAWRTKYKRLSELAQLFATVDEQLEMVQR